MALGPVATGSRVSGARVAHLRLYAEELTEQIALADRRTAFLAKPFAREQLLGEVRRVMAMAAPALENA
jgi:hypothetical protein